LTRSAKICLKSSFVNSFASFIKTISRSTPRFFWAISIPLKRIAVNELAKDILEHGEKGLPKTMRERRVFDWFVEVGLVKAVPELTDEVKWEKVGFLRDVQKVSLHTTIAEQLKLSESHLVREHIESEFQLMFDKRKVQEIHDKLIQSIG